MMITVKHMRAAGMCGRGSRGFFEEQGFSWNDFLFKGGIDSEKLRATGNPHALKVVEMAEAEARANGE